MSLSFIESSGIEGNSITVNVSYRAPIEHSTDWLIRYSAADTYRTGENSFDVSEFCKPQLSAIWKIVQVCLASPTKVNYYRYQKGPKKILNYS